MTNKEAAEMIRNDMKLHHDSLSGGYRKALSMAISALQEQELKQEVKNSTESSLTQKGLDTISRTEAINALDALCGRECEYSKKQRSVMCGACHLGSAFDVIEQLPSAQPEWNNHTVACLLAELFDDTCACNYNGIDEWLPSKCELLDSCPNPVGVACWEQFLKHRTERRTDEGD
jgi:hypothetical protein